MMLVLNRTIGETIRIEVGGEEIIFITLTQIRGKQVKLGIEASPDVRILREEIHGEPRRSKLTEKVLP